jgi:hypothetical protein
LFGEVLWRTISVANLVHILSSIVNGISVTAWRTELFPVLWSPTTTSYILSASRVAKIID